MINKQILKAVVNGELKREFLHLAKPTKTDHIFMKIDLENNAKWFASGNDWRLEATDDELSRLMKLTDKISTVKISCDE